MRMYWQSFSDFLTMGGHGLFVWGSYALTALVLVAELVLLTQRRRRAFDEARRWRLAHGDDGPAGTGTGSAR
jgi:heme exporter protein D